MMLTKDESVDAINRMSSSAGIKILDAYARDIAIDFHDWQKKDYAECSADMSTEDYFQKYLKREQ